MTIIAVMREASKKIGMDVPDAVFSSTEREHVELASVTNEMAKRIAKAREWQIFNTIATYTGDGATEDFALPADYDRMLKKANLRSSSLAGSFTHIPDRDRWLEFIVQASTVVTNAWIIYGGQMHIKPALASGVTAKHFYQSNLLVTPLTGSNKTTFTLDDDSFRLAPQGAASGILTAGEELLKLGIVWQWKANKGQPYAEDMANYEDMLSIMSSDDKGSRIIHIGSQRTPKGVTMAYPGTISA